MKPLALLLPILFLFASTAAAQSKADVILGEWISELKDGKINIYKQGDQFHGKIVWNKTPGKKDEKNPDPKLRSRDILGLVILKGFSFGGDAWENGTIYDPKSGKTYSCILRTKDNHKVLDIRGFVGSPLLGRTSSWTRP
jgi:uncharacterized protein (DUF2147 family)